MLNISLFFLNGALSCGGNYWPVKSLGFLAVVEGAMLWPHNVTRRLGCYLALLARWLVATGFFLASVVYWLRPG